jgi:Predicted pPIWI-associating nuclease
MPRTSKDLEKKRATVVGFIEGQELTDRPAWGDLDILSTHTTLDGIEVDPEGIIFDGDEFGGVMNVHVTLHYGGHGDDGFTTSDSFPGDFHGRFDKGKPEVDQISVDTSSFYE